MNPEQRYLSERARLAKAGLRTEARGLAEAVLAPVQLRALVRRHPRLGVGSAALLGVLLGRSVRGPRAKPAVASTARWSRAIAAQLRQLLGSTFGALWLAGLRSPPVTPPPGGDGAAPDAAIRSAHPD